MTEQLKTLESRLSKAAGDAWLEANEYYFDVCNRDNNDPHYRELLAREKILFDAWNKVKAALEIVEIVDGAETVSVTETVSA